MTRRQLMNHFVEKAAAYNMLVLLDMHRLNDQFIPQLWYSDDHPIDDVLSGWDTVLGDLKKHWNVFAVDLKNEPFGVATWGTCKLACSLLFCVLHFTYRNPLL